MQVLVTGATGLVGSFICRELLSNGHSVRATKRESSKYKLLTDIQNQIEWVDGEIGNAIFWDDLLSNVDAVIHAAAIISFDRRWEKRMYETNVLGTTDLINAVLRSKVQNFIHVSSIAAIGRNPEKASLTENDKWEGSSFDSIYAQSKYYQELEVWRGAEEGLNVKIVNPSLVLGPGEWSNTGSTSVFKYAYDQKLFCPAGSANYVDVRDLASIVLKLLQSEVSNERFIVNAGSTSYKTFFGAIAQRFNKKGPSRIPSAWMLKMAVYFEWLRSRLTGNQAMITKETALISMTHFHFDNQKIMDTLQFKFRELDETLDWATSELKKAHSL